MYICIFFKNPSFVRRNFDGGGEERLRSGGGGGGDDDSAERGRSIMACNDDYRAAAAQGRATKRREREREVRKLIRV